MNNSCWKLVKKLSVKKCQEMGESVYLCRWKNRQNENEFLAYDRLPPNEPDACTDSHGNTTRLVVEFPFVVDHCNNAYYNILNGQIIVAEPDMIPIFPTDEGTIYPLIQYHTQYDGQKLTIYNWVQAGSIFHDTTLPLDGCLMDGLKNFCD